MTRAAPTVPFQDVLRTEAELEALFTPPASAVAAKKLDHLDEGAAALIAAAPLVLLGTADADGRCTVSPRGGDPGSVRVLDRHRLAIPDAAGNRLLDSSRNLLVNPQIGMLFVLPGRTWALRVAGRAWLTRDPEALGPEKPDPPARGQTGLAIGVQVEQLYVHCGRALELSRVWQPESWEQVPAPDAAEVFRGHVAYNRSTTGGPAA